MKGRDRTQCFARMQKKRAVIPNNFRFFSEIMDTCPSNLKPWDPDARALFPRQFCLKQVLASLAYTEGWVSMQARSGMVTQKTQYLLAPAQESYPIHVAGCMVC